MPVCVPEIKEPPMSTSERTNERHVFTSAGAAALGLTLGLLISASSAPAAAPVGQTIWLRAVANSQYVSADQNATNTPLRASRTTIGAWEQFQIVDAGSGLVTIRSVGNNLFVSADQNFT